MQKTGEDDQKTYQPRGSGACVLKERTYRFLMNGTITVSELSLPQKLKLMEELWAELSREPKNVPVPEWHLETLVEREKLFLEGKAKFSDWSEAKQRLTRR
jgi:hypothetical protein